MPEKSWRTLAMEAAVEVAGLVAENDRLRTELANAGADLERLEAALRGLLDAINWAWDVGCIDHLDCSKDSPEKWYQPQEKARAALAQAKGATDAPK